MERNYESVGTFEVESGTMMVSDPCYNAGTWCQGVVDKARIGMWEAFTVKGNYPTWGERCAELLVLYEGLRPNREDLSWERLPFEVGVDSGQAGIFDIAHYRRDDDTEGWDSPYGGFFREDGWYGMCGSITLSDRGVGVIPFGAVSRSGFGDGGYTAYAAKGMSGMIVGIKIIFITDKYMDEEEEDAV